MVTTFRTQPPSSRRPAPSACRVAAMLLAAFLTVPAVAAPPANDDFAAAIAIPGAVPTEVIGSNAEATEEVNEPLPTAALSSVWWRWTPAASGWVKIATLTDTDTILAAYSGNSLGSLQRLAFNDDADLDDVGPSQIRLLAQAGETVMLQVSGYDGESGPITLSLEPTAAPPAVTGISLTPATADVTAAEVTITLQATVTTPVPVQDAWFSVFRPGEDELVFALASMPRTTGTDTNGTYRGSLVLPRFLAPELHPFRLSVLLTDGSISHFGENTSRPAGLPSGIPVVNSNQSDTSPPTLASLTLGPSSTVDVANSAQTVQIVARIVDQPAGTLDFSNTFRLGAPGSDFEFEESLSYRNRQNGDTSDGTYRFSVVIPRGSPPGSYPLVFELQDRLGNAAVFGPDLAAGQLPFPQGFPTVLTVVNSGTIDTQPPLLTASSLSPTVLNALAQEPTEVSLTFTDALSGVASAEMSGSNAGLRPVAGGPVIPLTLDFSPDSEASANGEFTAFLYVPTTLLAGDYDLVGIRVADALGNSVTYGPAALGYTPFPAGTAPRLTITREQPVTPFAIWLAQYPSLSGPTAGRNADPDGDGFPNLVELALGLDPTKSSTPNGNDPARSLAPRIIQTANRLTLAYTVATANLGSGPFQISVLAQESENIQNWDGAQIFILGGGEFEAFTAISKGQKRYLRLLVTDPAAP